MFCCCFFIEIVLIVDVSRVFKAFDTGNLLVSTSAMPVRRIETASSPNHCRYEELKTATAA